MENEFNEEICDALRTAAIRRNRARTRRAVAAMWLGYVAGLMAFIACACAFGPADAAAENGWRLGAVLWGCCAPIPAGIGTWGMSEEHGPLWFEEVPK